MQRHCTSARSRAGVLARCLSGCTTKELRRSAAEHWAKATPAQDVQLRHVGSPQLPKPPETTLHKAQGRPGPQLLTLPAPPASVSVKLAMVRLMGTALASDWAAWDPALAGSCRMTAAASAPAAPALPLSTLEGAACVLPLTPPAGPAAVATGGSSMPSDGGSGVGVLAAFLVALLRLGGLLPSLCPLAGRLWGADASSALNLQPRNGRHLQRCNTQRHSTELPHHCMSAAQVQQMPLQVSALSPHLL